jgi:hypothetical protein
VGPGSAILDADDQDIIGASVFLLGCLMAARVLGSPPDVDRTHTLAHHWAEADDDVSSAWMLEVACRFLAGDDGVVSGTDPEELFDAAVDAVHLLAASGAFTSPELAELMAEAVDRTLSAEDELRSLHPSMRRSGSDV